jgi:hypothetical protein
MTGLVVGMSDLLQRTLGEGISVRVSLAADLWAVEADPTEYEAAILNLAVNARDAMPDGGELLIEAANVEFTADAGTIPQNSARGFYVMVAVTDTGAGMPPGRTKLSAACAAERAASPRDDVGNNAACCEVRFQRFAGANSSIASENERGRCRERTPQLLRSVARNETSGSIGMQDLCRLRGKAVIRDAWQVEIERVTGVEVPRAGFGLRFRRRSELRRQLCDGLRQRSRHRNRFLLFFEAA